MDLFAGIPVTDFPAALAWYERFFGGPPAFFPHDTEAVWEVAEHRYLYIVLEPAHAGHARHTLFLEDFDTWLGRLAERGLEPAKLETYENDVRKATFADPDGNEIGLGGGPA
jgi:hypothetical protein